MAYTTKEKVEQYIGESITDDISAYIQAVTDYIEKFTGRVFEAPVDGSDLPEDEERLFEGKYSPALLVDDLLSVTKVYVGDTYGETFEEVTDYVLFPLNGTPKTKIVLKKNWGVGIHKVEGVFAYSETVPADIELASTILVAGMVSQTNSQVVKSESIGDYSVSYSDETVGDYLSAMTILDKYKRYFI